MMVDLTGKRVLVTGGSRGIGYAVARAFIATGAEVCVLAERDEVFEAARRLSVESGRNVHAIHCDITDRSAPECRSKDSCERDVSIKYLSCQSRLDQTVRLVGRDENTIFVLKSELGNIYRQTVNVWQ